MVAARRLSAGQGQQYAMQRDLRALVVDAMSDAVIVTDPGGVIRLWNRGAEAIFGFNTQEALGQPLEIIIPERMRAAHDAGFERAVTTGTLRVEGQVMTTRGVGKGGKRVYVDFTFGLLRDTGGGVTGVYAVGRDVTAAQLAKQTAKTPV